MSFLVESTIKVSLVILTALAAMALLRTRSAALRHWVLAVAVVGAAFVPALGPVAPSWHVRFERPVATVSVEPAIETVVADTQGQPSGLSAPSSGRSSAGVVTVNIERGLVAAWAVGAGVGFGILLIGFARLAWLAAAAHRVVDGKWIDLVEDVSRAYGLGRPVQLLQSSHPAMLVTWGLMRPKVILPAGAPEWPEDRVRVVLSHELAHIRRADWVVQMAAECLRSVYWFNPLLWIACRRLRQDAEQACDDAVLSLGVEGSEYATQLLDLARAVGRHRRTWLPAPAMAHTSSLERRVEAMLNTDVNRRPIARSVRVSTAAALLAVAVLVAGFGVAAQGSFATFSGTVSDSTGGFLPAARAVLTNVQNQATHEVSTDRAGHFEFVGLPPGDYLFQMRLAGFANFQSHVTLVGKNVNQDVSMQIGSLEESITVTDSGQAGPPPVPRTVERLPRREPPAPNAPSTAVGNIGGNIKPPMKTFDVRPVYPENRVGSGAETTVVLDVRIGTDGLVREVQVVGSPDPDFAQAAVDAVSKWEFTPTLLNGLPMEVSMKATLQFIAHQRVIRLQITLPTGEQPLITSKNAELATLALGDGRSYGVRALVQDVANSAVRVLITEGAAANGKMLYGATLKPGQPAVPSGTTPPLQIAVLDVQ